LWGTYSPPQAENWVTVNLTDFVREKVLEENKSKVTVIVEAVPKEGVDSACVSFASNEHVPTSTQPPEPYPQFTVRYIPPTPRVTKQIISLDDTTGKLVYESYGNEKNYDYGSQASTVSTNTVPDYSWAGYQGGGVPIPFVPTQVIVNPPPSGDSYSLIQGAIDQVSDKTPDSDGFRGAVLIKAGTYQVSAPLVISTSGVIIRGEGSEANGGTTITYTSTVRDSDLFTFQGSGGRNIQGTSRTLTTDTFVPAGSYTITLIDASIFAVGNEVMLRALPNDTWAQEMSNMLQWGWYVQPIPLLSCLFFPHLIFNPVLPLLSRSLSRALSLSRPNRNPAGYDIEYRRIIVDIDYATNKVTLNAPLVTPIESYYGGAELSKYTFPGQLENVGIENMRLLSTYASETDENHGRTAVKFDQVLNGWYVVYRAPMI
jgi:hypothetical protein